MKILVVDDSEMQRKIAGIYLAKGEGFEVSYAVNGKEACEKAVLEKPDLVILDIEMPVTGGWEALKRLKGDPRTSSITVLMCSNIEENNGQIDWKKMGADGYIRKPHGFKGLKSKIADLQISGSK